MIAETLKMFYQIFVFAFTLLSFVINLFFLFCNLFIPFFLLTCLLTLMTTKFIKLHEPQQKIVDALLKFGHHKVGDTTTEDALEFPIANKGGIFDVPENSRAALKQCAAKQCRNILLDLNVTKCKQLVVLNQSTLEKTGIKSQISELKLTGDDLKNMNIVANHPLECHFAAEEILCLDTLLQQAQELNLRIYLLATNSSQQMIESLRKHIDQKFIERCILCTTSPLMVYQLRKQFADLVCGLWINKPMAAKSSFLFRTSAILNSCYMAIVRNIVAPVIGIKVVFLHKDEFNAHVQTLWHSVGVKSVVYTVNSPNEKRYFQQVIKSQYLTDSLRSEPQIIFKSKKF